MQKIEEMIAWNKPGVFLSLDEYLEILRGVPVYTISDLRFYPNLVPVPCLASLMGKQVYPIGKEVYVWNYCAWCGTSAGPVKGRCKNCGGWI